MSYKHQSLKFAMDEQKGTNFRDILLPRTSTLASLFWGLIASNIYGKVSLICMKSFECVVLIFLYSRIVFLSNADFFLAFTTPQSGLNISVTLLSLHSTFLIAMAYNLRII